MSKMARGFDSEQAELERLRKHVTEMVKALEAIKQLTDGRMGATSRAVNETAAQVLNSYRGIV